MSNSQSSWWRRLSLLYCTSFLFLIGLFWADITLEAAFLNEVGVAFLPWFFTLRAVFVIPAVAIYTAFADRVSPERVLFVMLGVSVLTLGIGLGLLAQGWTVPAYLLLYLMVPLSELMIFTTHWYTYINTFYDTQEAKRVTLILGSANGVSAVIAGQSMAWVQSWFAPSGIVMIWIGTLVGMGVLVWLMPFLLGERRRTQQDPTAVSAVDVLRRYETSGSYLGNIRESFYYISHSPFLRWLTVSILLVMVLLTALQYQAGVIFLAELQTTEQIAVFLGRVVSVANAILLPVQIFLLSNIVNRIGVGNSYIIYPSITLLICLSLILVPFMPTLALWVAALAYFTRTDFYASFGQPVTSLLYNAVPLRVKARARAFISGLIIPIGSMIGGLLLFLPLAQSSWFVPTLIGVVSAALVASAFMVRQQYSRALIKMLEEEDFSFLLTQETTRITAIDPATISTLKRKLAQSESHELTIFMAKLLAQVGGQGQDTVSALGESACNSRDGRTRAAIIEVMIAARLRGDAVYRLYTELLHDADSQVRKAAIIGLEHVGEPGDAQLQASLLTMLDDPDPDVAVSSLLTLVRMCSLQIPPQATRMLYTLLLDERPSQRAYGIQVLRQIGNERAIRRLITHLDDPADEVRLEAVLALEHVSQNGLPEHLSSIADEQIIHLVQDPIQRVRQAALVILGRIGTRESNKHLLAALTDESQEIRAAAVDALVHHGKSTIALMHKHLDSPDPHMRKMAAVVLGRVSPGEFGSLISTHITGNLLAIYRNYGFLHALAPYTTHASISILQGSLQEDTQKLLDEIFYLLSALHPAESVKVVRETSQSSDPLVRANATEALETMTTPQTAQVMSHLFAPNLNIPHLLRVSSDVWDMEHPQASVVIKELVAHPHNPWWRAVATFALGEIGRALVSGSPVSDKSAPSPTAPSPAATEQGAEPLNLNQPDKKPRRSRRAQLPNLLSALESEESPAPPRTRQAGKRQAAPVLAGSLLSLEEIQALLQTAHTDAVADVRIAAQAASQMLIGERSTSATLDGITDQEDIVLSTIERIIFLKEVPFFLGMTIDQLRVIATVCEEALFPEDTRIINQGDPGGTLFVIVNGRVGIEQEKRKGHFARLSTLEAHAYFGEMSLFDNSPHTAAAIALQDTLTLKLHREPVIALARQHPDLSLALINVLSQRLREVNDRIADLTRSRPRELHKLFDQYE